MTDKEILQRAIEKAEKNNFDYNWESQCYSYTSQYHCIQPIHLKYPELIIFSHDFAKAFWGEEICDEYCPCNLEYRVAKFIYVPDENYPDGIHRKYGQSMKNWEYHLQQMVLEEEPLKYLEKFL